MTLIHIIVGSNTDQVSTLKFDTETGKLSKSSSVTVGNKPSWVTAHPRNKSIIFTALKIKGAKLIVLEFDGDGKGKVVGEAPTGGDGPSSLIAGEHDVVVGNYDDGTIFTVPTLNQAPFIDSAHSQFLRLVGSGPHPTRQTSSHPHQVLLNGADGDVFIPDLGADKTWLLTKNEQGSYQLSERVFSSLPGSGPRHASFHGNFIYVLHELNDTLSSFDIRQKNPAASHSLPSTILFSEAVKTPDAVTAGEILIPTPNSSFPVPYIYVSNRYDSRPDGGDTIGIFHIMDPDAGKFEYVGEVETQFKQLRGMEFVGEDGRWLVAGGVFEGGVKIFERIDGGKSLKLVAETSDVDVPCSFVELKL
ncbi:hypothetical protein PM082_015389 [Marasmius tenuissimus]|nr:hypothetical protein PM082_015389 [Marasmius tenuissimus]